MSYLTNKEFLLEVAKGKVAGHTLVRRFGINADVDIAAEEDICSYGGIVNWQTSAQTLEAVSTDADDLSATGTGARTIKVWGLDSAYAEANTTVSMNGVTPVTLSGTWIDIDRAEILTTGSTASNEGDIDVRILSAGAILARVPTLYGQAYRAGYFVPTGKTAYLIGWESSLYKATSGSAELRLYTAEDGVGWRVQAIQELTQTGAGVSSASAQSLLLELPAKTRVVVRAKASVDNLGVASSLTFVVI